MKMHVSNTTLHLTLMQKCIHVHLTHLECGMYEYSYCLHQSWVGMEISDSLYSSQKVWGVLQRKMQRKTILNQLPHILYSYSHWAVTRNNFHSRADLIVPFPPTPWVVQLLGWLSAYNREHIVVTYVKVVVETREGNKVSAWVLLSSLGVTTWQKFGAHKNRCSSVRNNVKESAIPFLIIVLLIHSVLTLYY